MQYKYPTTTEIMAFLGSSFQDENEEQKGQQWSLEAWKGRDEQLQWYWAKTKKSVVVSIAILNFV